MSSLVSVIIPNYNYARYLPVAIESVLAQTYPQIEIIVVDDGSKDGSQRVLLNYGSQIRWFQQPNQGVSAARNLGIEKSSGEFIAFLDADDIWDVRKLEIQLPLFQDSSVGVVYCGSKYINKEGEVISGPAGKPLTGQREHVLTRLALLRDHGPPAFGSTAVVRRECFNQIGMFDVKLSTSADWDLLRRLVCHYGIEFAPEELLLYRQHNSSMHRNIEVFERDMLHAFAKMFSDPAASEIYDLRRHCYGNLYMTLAGSYLHAGKWNKCLSRALYGLTIWPPSIVYLTQFPLRLLRRRFGLQTDDPNLV